MSNLTPIKCEECQSLHKGIFCDLKNPDLEEITKHKVTNKYKKGQTLYFQGNPPFGVYCVSNGKVKITKVGPEGKESILKIAGEGDLLGHKGLYSQDYYEETATTLEDSTVCFIDKKFITKAISEKPSIAVNLIHLLEREMGEAHARVVSMHQKNVEERLAELLLLLKESFGVRTETPGQWFLDIKLKREEMASMVGMAEETLIRLLSQFKSDGFISQDKRNLFIDDEKGLLAVANIE